MSDPDRYSRQVRFTGLGLVGQERIRAATVVVIGVGSLGTVIAEQLTRAGIGRLRLVDRDFVEWSNLNRQSLYDEADAAACLPKAVAAARRLAQINRDVIIEPLVTEVTARSVRSLVAGADVVLDGCDNFRLRHLVNEACVEAKIPWIYGACVGAYGVSVPITPGVGPCLACLQDVLPDPGDSPTCDTAGIIAPAVHLVAAWQVAEALKLIAGVPVRQHLWASDLWAGTHQHLDVSSARNESCAVCGPQPTYPHLNGPADGIVVLCGRDAVQITRPQPLDPQVLATRVPATVVNDYLVRWSDGAALITAFKDGRVIVQGVADPVAARVLADRWLG